MDIPVKPYSEKIKIPLGTCIKFSHLGIKHIEDVLGMIFVKGYYVKNMGDHSYVFYMNDEDELVFKDQQRAVGIKV